MKKIIYLILALPICIIAQTNTLPTSGSVGIGTTSPYFKLGVHNPSGTIGDITARVLNANVDSSSDANIRVETTQANSGDPAIQYWIGGVGGWYSGIDNSDSDKFKISSGKWGSEFTIKKDGTIGMGTANPNYWLDLGGGKNANNLFRAQGLYSTVEFSGNHVANSSSKGVWSFINTGTFSDTRFYVEDANNSNDRLTFDFRGNGGTTQILSGTSIGNVGIGTTTPDSKLTVAGKVHAQEVKVTVTAGADFVFEESYQPPSLKELESFIKTNKHLPEIASAKEMEIDGLELGEMNIKLLQKIEELTLYIIEQEKDLNYQENEMKFQNGRIEKLEKENKKMNTVEERLRKIENQLNK